MRSRATRAFWAAFQKLPESVQKTSGKQYRLWIQDPNHPSVKFKKVQLYWSARINDNHRALGIMNDDTVIWFWIGNHSEYEKLLKGK
jgi:Txe/YoeB family toxin of Txe-Axe toxin-antitoxin module